MLPTDTTFQPFQPMFEENSKVPVDPMPTKSVRARKPRPKTVSVPATPTRKMIAAVVKKPRKKTAKRKARTAPTKAPTKAPTAVRAARVANRKPRAHKVDLDVALSIGAALKPGDLKAFGDIRQHLQSVNKATRTRILRAITQVFA